MWGGGGRGGGEGGKAQFTSVGGSVFKVNLTRVRYRKEKKGIRHSCLKKECELRGGGTKGATSLSTMQWISSFLAFNVWGV